MPNAICMHEEDIGILWKHFDFRTGATDVRRSRRLVISTIATVGNYDYGFFWYLYQDGTIEFEVKLTGVIPTGALRAASGPGTGRWSAPGLTRRPSALLLRPARPGRRRQANTVVQVDSDRRPWAPRGRRGARSTSARRRRRRRSTRCTGATGGSRTRQAVGARRARRLQAGPGRHRGAASAPDSRFGKRAAFTGTTSGSRRTTRPSATRPATTRTSTPAATGCRATPPPTARSRTPTSSSGTLRLPPLAAAGGLAGHAGLAIGFQLKPRGFFDGNPRSTCRRRHATAIPSRTRPPGARARSPVLAVHPLARDPVEVAARAQLRARRA